MFTCKQLFTCFVLFSVRPHKWFINCSKRGCDENIIRSINFNVNMNFPGQNLSATYQYAGVRAKVPPISFSPLTSPKWGISPQNLLTWSFSPFLYCCKILRPHLVLVANYWTWIKTNPQKIGKFNWSNPYKIERNGSKVNNWR